MVYLDEITDENIKTFTIGLKDFTKMILNKIEINKIS